MTIFEEFEHAFMLSLEGTHPTRIYPDQVRKYKQKCIRKRRIRERRFKVTEKLWPPKSALLKVTEPSWRQENKGRISKKQRRSL